MPTHKVSTKKEVKISTQRVTLDFLHNMNQGPKLKNL